MAKKPKVSVQTEDWSEPWPGQRENVVTPHPDPTDLTRLQFRLTEDSLRRDMAALRELIETRLDAMDEATKLRLTVVDDIPIQVSKDIDHLHELMTSQFEAAGHARQQEIDLLRNRLIREVEQITELRLKDIASVRELVDTKDVAAGTNHKRDVEYLREAINDSVTNLKQSLGETERRFTGLLDKDTSALRQALVERDTRFGDAAVASQKALELALNAPAQAADKVEKATDRSLQALQATIKSDKDNADKVVQQLQSRLDRIEAGGIGRQEVATETTQARQYSTQFSMGMIALAIAFAAVIVPIIIKLVP